MASSIYSKVSSSTKEAAKYKKYHVLEVVTSLTEGKYIASDLADAQRYAYRASATLVGNVNIRPYEPIYLDGVPNGMSGYWTVLSVRHIFGSDIAKYIAIVELGTDIIGETNETAYKAADTRDVNAEISGQSIGRSSSVLMDYKASVNASTLVPPQQGSVNVSKSAFESVVDASSPDLYQNDVPDFSIIKRSTAWVATKKGTVL